MKKQFSYNVEILANTLSARSMKPRWENMLCIASSFETRKEAINFVNDNHLNKIECIFFVVTFHEPSRIPCRISKIS